jgi:carbonic anhydrase/acetyltransferase-like protein (isoleucine patch superfamily)
MIASVSGLTEKKPVVPASAWIADTAVVIGDVVLGEGANIWFHVVVRGDVHSIRIGENTNIQDGSILHVTQKLFSLTIGDRVTVGHKALMHGCTVGNDCLIGMGAVLLDGVEVGDGSVVAAGALLTPGKKFPPGSLIMGSPAKAVRQVTPEERRNLIDHGWKNYRGYSDAYRKTYQKLD